MVILLAAKALMPLNAVYSDVKLLTAGVKALVLAAYFEIPKPCLINMGRA